MYVFESLRSESRDDRIAEMLDYTTVCLNCGKKLELLKQTIGYCNQQCQWAKPPKMAWVEKEYKGSIKDIIETEIQNYPISILAGLWGIDTSTLYEWCRKLGVNLKDKTKKRAKGGIDRYAAQIIALYMNRTVRMEDIAGQYKCSLKTIYNLLNRYNISGYRMRNSIRVMHSLARCGRSSKYSRKGRNRDTRR